MKITPAQATVTVTVGFISKHTEALTHTVHVTLLQWRLFNEFKRVLWSSDSQSPQKTMVCHQRVTSSLTLVILVCRKRLLHVSSPSLHLLQGGGAECTRGRKSPTPQGKLIHHKAWLCIRSTWAGVLGSVLEGGNKPERRGIYSTLVFNSLHSLKLLSIIISHIQVSLHNKTWLWSHKENCPELELKRQVETPILAAVIWEWRDLS